MNDGMLDGLNSLVNMADKKPVAKVAPPDTSAGQGKSAFPVEDPALSRQILDRLDGIRDAIDALRAAPVKADTASPPVKASPAAPLVKVANPAAPPVTADTPAARPVTASPQVVPAMGRVSYLILVSAALELLAFALGMSYGAIVASGRFPFWYRPGVAGILIDWVAAPAGVLLLPVMAGLLALGGWELQREGREKAAIAVWALAGGLAVIALLVPFLA